MKGYKVAALTHKHTDIESLGCYQLKDDQRTHLAALKSRFEIDELIYLNTCNRVELIVYSDGGFNRGKAAQFFQAIAEITGVCQHVTPASIREVMDWYEGETAVEHLFRVAASLESMVVGEREIITQYRRAYEQSREEAVSGDYLRLLSRFTIETAKQVYTETLIARRPVSVSSLAFHQFKDRVQDCDAPILMIGAGQTNRDMYRFLDKAGFRNIRVFNRTREKAEALVKDASKAHSLVDLHAYKGPVAAIFTCTSANNPHITGAWMEQLPERPVCIVDLAVPGDTEVAVQQAFGNRYIGVQSLKTMADRNLREREKEVVHCLKIISDRLQDFMVIFEERRIERALRDIPNEVKAVKQRAMEQVFHKELAEADDATRVLVERMLSYMEKKCVGIPIRVAKKSLSKQ